MKKISLFGLAIFLLSFALSALAEQQWKVDQAMGFHLSLLDVKSDDQFRLKKNLQVEFVKPDSLKLTPEWRPDIDNIQLTGLLGLGFPVPSYGKRDAELKYYLKLYRFPSQVLDPMKSTRWLVDLFLLDRMDSQGQILSFIQKSENLIIKKGTIDNANTIYSESNPIPPLAFKRSKNLQSDFNKKVLFSSLYVLPTAGSGENKDEAARAKWSAQGVVSFHQEMHNVLVRHMKPIEGLEPQKFEYFLRSSNCQQSDSCQFVVLRYPKSPMVFDNYRDLPMPANPEKEFVSGLLLVRGDIYAGKIKNDKHLTVEMLDKRFKKIQSHMFEVGSIFRVE